jgi:O-antigen ligase
VLGLCAAALGCSAGLGLLVGLLPLAIVFPEREDALVCAQAAGAVIGLLSLILIVPVGWLAARYEANDHES